MNQMVTQQQGAPAQQLVLNPAQLPAAFQALMAQTQQNDLTQNVGATYAALSIKGKVFSISFNGETKQMLVEWNGGMYAAPNLDIVMLKGNAHLSKTYYKDGYKDGDDAPPTCWSEDGINPLAPMQQRPIVEINGTQQYCTDCRLCPMNAFGSKVNDATGSAGKACADTRKIAFVLADDIQSIRYSGAMLLRVPAASLKPVAEYARKLEAMGVPYYAVVTRLTFDQSLAYPKLVLQPVRPLSEQEAVLVLEHINGSQIRSVLALDHVQSAPALPAPAAQQAPMQVPAAMQGHAPQGLTNTAAPQAPAQPAPVQVAPQPAAPAQPAPVPVAPQPAVAPQPVYAPQPAAQPGPAPVAAPVAPAPVQPAPVQPAPVAPAPVQAFNPAQAAPGPGPAAAAVMPTPQQPAAAQPGVQVTPDLLSRVEGLLQS